MLKYILNTPLFARRNIATFLRKPKLLAYIYALLAPWRLLRYSFYNENNSEISVVGVINKKLSFSSQTLILETLLQEIFTNNNKQVTITTLLPGATNVRVGFQGEDTAINEIGFQSEAGHSVELGFQEEMDDQPFNFIVLVDIASGFNVTTDTDNLAKLKAIVDRYKLSGTTYKVTN